MDRIRVLVAACATLLLLPASSTDAAAPKVAGNVGLAQKIIKERLFDPYSVRFENTAARAGVDRAGKPERLVCGSYNAKNRYGAYIGAKRFVYVPSEKAVYTVQIEKLFASGGSITADGIAEDSDGSSEQTTAALKLLNALSSDVEFWLRQCV